MNRVFSNVGKALEAYQRRIVCRDTRFDRFLAGEDPLEPLLRTLDCPPPAAELIQSAP
ncbi:MAG: hypothetical protein WBV82_28960 [Myxococcaceae bacterium]